MISLSGFRVLEADREAVSPPVPESDETWVTAKIGDRWAGRDHYLWLIRTIQIPENWIGHRAVGVFDFGTTGGGGNSGFEAMCYLDGKPYQGVDVNHQEVFFPEELYGKTVK